MNLKERAYLHDKPSIVQSLLGLLARERDDLPSLVACLMTNGGSPLLNVQLCLLKLRRFLVDDMNWSSAAGPLPGKRQERNSSST
jgi:hypothetical protein